jgi:AraC-like DNA-binding protein
LLLSAQGVVEATIQRQLANGVFDIAGSKTPSASEYGAVFHSPIRFDADVSAIAVPSRWLSIPNPLADPRALADALSELEAMERRFRQGSWIVREVKRILAESDAVPPLSSVAKGLRLSRRTLERLLKQSHASYRELVARSRRRRAEHWLRDGTLTIAEVAYRLGYADPANFAKACRRWFGMSPSDYRKLHAVPTKASGSAHNCLPT